MPAGGDEGIAMGTAEHYLKTELYDLVRGDPAIFEFLQAGSLDGIWYWDVERQDQEWMSPRFKELFGYRDDEIPNTSAWWMENIFPEDLAVALENFGRHLEDPNHPYDQIVRYRHRDGGTVWVRCRGLAIRNASGKAVRLLGCHTDVTALKRAEEDLRRQAAELREARDAAERASRAKSTFLANVSHEIRTPLNGVIGMAELLADTDLAPRQQEQAVAIRESAEVLLEIINDILDFSKIEAGRLVPEPHPFRLRERLGVLIRSFAPRVRGKDVALTADVAPDTPDALVGDARLLRQVLANLLSNAIKFTERGAVTLRARPRERAAGAVTLAFEVSDTGIGIPAEKQRVIFEEFVQADPSTTRRYGGTGLGLAIATRLVDALGGEIDLTSTPGAGSTFRITARFEIDAAAGAAAVDAAAAGDAAATGSAVGAADILAAGTAAAGDVAAAGAAAAAGDVAAAGAAAAAGDRAAAGGGMAAGEAMPPAPEADPAFELPPLRVLLVEDSVANQRVATGMLEKASHTVRVASDGSAAVDACAAERFDLVLMDLQMPGMDGYAATRAIRGREEARGDARTPIVALTARASRGSEAACLAAGFDGYLLKPYRSRELTEALAAGLGRAPQAAPGAAASAATVPPPATGRLDWAAAVASLDGDRELLRTALDGFLGQHASLAAELREAVAADDRPAAQRAAHTIGGSLRFFRDARVVTLAAALEDRCGDGGPEQVAAAWHALEPELDAAVAEIRDRVGKRT